jgi:hypothetical protein
MLRILKINTATLICFAFIFRLLFVNIGVVSSLNINQSNFNIKRPFSNIIKQRRKSIDPINNPVGIGFSPLEILEEGSDNDHQFKLNPYALTNFFYPKIECKLKNTLKLITPFNKYFCYKSSNRYIEYQVFRI